MNEKYIHHLWKNKLIPFHRLKLTEGEEFTIQYVGDYNENDSGPDFLNARILINNIVWVGNVEIHLKSGDWYQHKHHLDPAYDNVILHVVIQDNRDVFIKGKKLKTLQLEGFIPKLDKDGLNLFRLKHEILCGSQIQNLDPVHLEFAREKALINKFERTIDYIDNNLPNKSEKDVLYFLLAKAMGNKVNKLPFEELSRQIEINDLKNLSPELQYELILFSSGLFYSIEPSDLLMNQFVLSKTKSIKFHKLNAESWKFGGVRPGNSPVIRIDQFAKIVAFSDFNTEFVFYSLRDLINYFFNLLSTVESQSLKINSRNKFSKTFKEHLLINCFAPFLYWWGMQNENPEVQIKGVELLRLLKPEKNSIIEKWLKFGCIPIDAAQSQGLIELYNQSCSLKKCLLCSVGIQLLNAK